ncbi:MAG: methyltransferase domain-containing protein [Anaerolineaceae bacterium]|nr:methyltransferase domain-containing protein [Anaerolineaceae bacterium]MCB9100619.1 methyltransferase domain-containing protein [Anaerolineales bacterium]
MDIFARYRSIVDDWAAFQDSLFRPLPVCIWANPLRVTPDQLAGIFTTDGVRSEPLAWYPGGRQLEPDFRPGHHWAFLAGLYHTQEAVSMLPVLLLDPQPGERVLDLCAAPGNKTAQIAVRLANHGTVIANDISGGRMRAARQTFERLGLLNITTTTADGNNYPPAAGLFDKILVDAPCSCEGTSRKEPNIIERTGEAVSCKKSGSQKALLRKAVQLCRPGGRIVYATCTYAPEENELVVDAVLRDYPSVRLVSAEIDGWQTSAGITTWQGQALDPSLRWARRIWPHHNDTGGFFIAVLEKDHNGETPLNSQSSQVAPVAVEWPASISPEVRELSQVVLDRFGLSPAAVAPNVLFQPSNWRVYLVNPDHRPCPAPTPDASGMIFIKTKGKYPKLSTAAAQLFGGQAVRNYLELDDQQAALYLARQDFDVPAAQSRFCTGPGYVLVQYRGFTLGVAVYYPHHEGTGGVVQSLFPKGWSPVKG